MKLTIHIFAIYMFALLLIPCGGGGIVEILNHLSGTEHQHVSDHDQHSNGCGDDTCTPFCVCSCCSIALDIPPKLPLLVKYLPLTLAKLPISFSNFNPISFHHSIWQPPRFS